MCCVMWCERCTETKLASQFLRLLSMDMKQVVQASWCRVSRPLAGWGRCVPWGSPPAYRALWDIRFSMLFPTSFIALAFSGLPSSTSSQSLAHQWNRARLQVLEQLWSSKETKYLGHVIEVILYPFGFSALQTLKRGGSCKEPLKAGRTKGKNPDRARREWSSASAELFHLLSSPSFLLWEPWVWLITPWFINT